MQFIPVALTIEANAGLLNYPECAESLQESINFYSRSGFTPPWICYYATENGELIGCAGYKGPPVNGRVEIAYGTFPTHQQKGVGTRICQKLVELALLTDPSVSIIAHTLAQDNYSSRILKKNGFAFTSSFEDEEDGMVWLWSHQPDSK
ncbi:N-acetyltransferase [Mucilaginibacter terrenus]|uniref:N-acetyltransferase n=1 Tax=Mucilaginibacter terrenus TaxID=2482727 RepID=A0A3E2NUC3_9SPHI|nr:GNAT family protein [Mucilaginibacter terrenus]RFZ84613.1 N-acetyltransferase [Mucilaginibacter terrenus]